MSRTVDLDLHLGVGFRPNMFKKQWDRFCGWLARKLKKHLQDKNEKLFQDQQKKIEEYARLNTKYAQDTCRHIAGCNVLSEKVDPFGRTSIIWHSFNDGIAIGICTVCQRIFKPSDTDYEHWKGIKSFNKGSAANSSKYTPIVIQKGPLLATAATAASKYGSITSQEYYQNLDKLSNSDIRYLLLGIASIRAGTTSREEQEALNNRKVLPKDFGDPWLEPDDFGVPLVDFSKRSEEENEPA